MQISLADTPMTESSGATADVTPSIDAPTMK